MYVCFKQFWLVLNENFNPIPVSMSSDTLIWLRNKTYDIKTELAFFISASISVESKPVSIDHWYNTKQNHIGHSVKSLKYTPQPLYNTIVGVHSIDYIS